MSAHLCGARKGVPVRRGIKTNVLKRITANRQRAAEVMEQEARDREAMRLLNQRPNQVKEKVK